MFKKVYIVSSVLMILWYLLAAVNGWEFGTPEKQFVPADVRSASGGYRSFHFWHTGFHGGK